MVITGAAATSTDGRRKASPAATADDGKHEQRSDRGPTAEQQLSRPDAAGAGPKLAMN